MESEKYFTKTYTYDGNIQIDSLISIAKEFENEDVKFSRCGCSTFDENDCSLFISYKEIDDIAQIDSAPSPYVQFSLDYCNRKTLDYCFSLSTYMNSDVLTYIVDKKRLFKRV